MSRFACLEKAFHKKCIYLKIFLINYVFVVFTVTFLVAQKDVAPMFSPSGGKEPSLTLCAERQRAVQPGSPPWCRVPWYQN